MKTILIILLTLTTTLTIAGSPNSIRSGNWENVTSWDSGILPTSGDTITIQAGHSISVTTNNRTCDDGATYLLIYGNLNFPVSGTKLHLGCESIVVVFPGGSITSHGGGGASNQITICGEEVYRTSDGTITGPASFGGVLPIEMTNVDLTSTDEGILLEWTTATETNNDYFSIQRSDDGINYYEVAVIDGAGNSTNTINYSYMDNVQKSGIYYYKIVQFDMDGHNESFGPYQIEKGSVIETNVYPNPAKDYINVYGESDEALTLRVYDMTGKIVKEQPINSNYETRIDLSEFQQGMYIFSVDSDFNSVQTKVQVMN